MKSIFKMKGIQTTSLILLTLLISESKQEADTTCTTGYYLRNGLVCTPCSPGYYCTGGTSPYQSKCSEGYYSAYAATVCTICPEGFYCASGSVPPTACAAHEYSIEGSTLCSTCPVGSVCSQGKITQCIPGEQCSSSTNTVKVPCPAGYQCPFPQDEALATLCPIGTYSSEGSVSCTLCPAGYSCPSQSLPPQACPGGFYQDLFGQITCKNCLKGYYCDRTVSTSPIRCEIGQFSPENAAACIDCPAGYKCIDQEIDAPNLCTKGTYSLAKSSYCIQCPEGYSCLDRKSMTKCGTGYYSLTGMDSCLQCPAGYECGSWGTPMPCGSGQYSMPGQVACTFCPIGNYCPSSQNMPVPCPIGQYQDETGQKHCKPCPDGYTCVDQTIAPVSCTAGQFTDQFHQQCYICPAGYDCGSKRYDDIKQCTKGTYSLAGENLCKPCPAGYFCEKPDQDKVVCADGTYSYEGQTFCTQCPAGYRCLDKKGKYMVRCLQGQYVSSLNGQCTDCPAGSACPNPEGGFDTFVACVAGTYSAAGQSYCTICPPGKYCPTTIGPLSETPCVQGTVSFGGAITCAPCPKNHECPSTSTMAPCPIYFYSDEGTGVCKKCPDGKQCNLPNTLLPGGCPNGYYIQTLDWKCQPCPYGYRCPILATTPIQCLMHQYQDTMASLVCKDCPAGYFSEAGGEYCQPIPAGFERSNFQILQPCAEGMYSDWGYAQCITCEPGFLCPTGGEIGTHYGCPKGSYCQKGVQTKCKPGQYGLIERARSEIEGCEKCPAGYYCSEGTENFELYPCPRGTYCPYGTGVPFECPLGTYNDEIFGRSISECKLCPMGRECAARTTSGGDICTMGYFCPLGSFPKQFPCPAGTFSGYRTGLKDQSECMVCPAGYHCPSGSAEPIATVPGYYQPHQGIGELAARVICPPGYYCPDEAMTAYKGYLCTPGYYCPAGSTMTNQKKCPEGTYSDSYEIFDAAQCFICPAGFKCGLATTALTIVNCPINQYCPPGTKASQNLKCPAGTYAPYLNSKSLDDCIPCPYGYYCLTGSDPVNCPIGNYCPKSTEYATQYPCPAGYFLDTTNGKVLGECKPCGVGNYCPQGSGAQIGCPVGKYNDFSNTASLCLDCPAGKYCPTVGTSFPPKCVPGKYSTIGASKCIFCEVGTYCPNEGTSIDEKNTQKCPAGVYCMRVLTNFADLDPTTGSTVTISGEYGLDVYPNLRDHFCPSGYYCPEGTLTIIECPAGTYNRLKGRKNILECQRVEPGYYTSVSALSSPTGPCDPGYYCPEGSTSSKQVPCPMGTFRGISTGSTPEDCAICTSGAYCPVEGMATPLACPLGFYCPLGTKYPEPCPEGTYGGYLSLTDSQSCTKCPSGKYCGKRNLTAPQDDCDEGYYCVKGAKRPEPTDKITGDICPSGGYCTKGVTSPQSCPDGKFNKFIGGEASTDCQNCWPGFYCQGQSVLVSCPIGKYCLEGTSVPSLIAQIGYYSPLASDRQYKCPRGTYNKLTEQGVCKQCEAGYYCGTSAITTDPESCPAGYYCPSYQTFKDAGTYYEKQKCPIGTYNPNTAQRSVTGCLPCPQNKYCATTGLITPTGTCQAGYFCKSYSDSATPLVLNVNGYYGPCPAGYYCLANANPVACDIGTFSPETNALTSAVCQKCTEGYYCSTKGLSAPVGKCDVGYYCPEGATTSQGKTALDSTTKPCPLYNYCPLGTASPILCPTGMYQEQTGQSKCNMCPKGYYCVGGKRTLCPVGYVCV